jgi:hypothetical protein
MNEAGLMDRLGQFACELIESAGGIAEWDSATGRGMGMAPASLASCLEQPGESIEVSSEAGDTGLSVNLAGNFLETTGRALERFVPACGAFAVDSLSIRKSDFQQVIDSSFGWQNARARILQVSAMPVAWHAWWFHATLRSEDIWEAVIPVAINCESAIEMDLGNLLETVRLATARNDEIDFRRSILPATRSAETRTMAAAGAFLARIDKRLQADRKRLREYYGAMLKESTRPGRRTRNIPTGEELADRERAVQLELKRKLLELDERFSASATLRPIAVAECLIPSSVIDLEIQRKTARRTFRLFWNGLLRKLEPFPCSMCHQGAFNFWFTNDTVDPVCNRCHK